MSRPRPYTDCVTDVAYLSHAELYKTVKPYVADYSGEGIARSNLKTDLVRDVCISDLRSERASKFAFWKDGFEVLRFDSTMIYDEWSDQETVESKYCAELGEQLVSQLGAVAVQAFEAVVRRRHATFPEGKIDVSLRGQPALRPHIDASPAQMSDRVKALAADTQFVDWQGSWMFINTWRPLRGPLRDWPLALCAPDSIDDNDLVLVDNVRGSQSSESQLLCSNQTHRWWYLSDQEPSEVLLFRQADSAGNRGVPHVSFRLPVDDEVVLPRESIEVRYIAWFEEPSSEL